MRILVTCPTMIQRNNEYINLYNKHDLTYYCPKFKQALTEEELIKLMPDFDGWIAGDDPITFRVLKVGKDNKLKAIVRWGVGTDNVDFEACKKLDLPVTNIPNSFGEEVSDVAVGYLLSLARRLHVIDQHTKRGEWYKPSGMSLSNKKVCLIGFGDIGQKIAKKLLSFNLKICVSDPGFTQDVESRKISCKYNSSLEINEYIQYNVNIFPNINEAVNQVDFIIIACSLNKYTQNLVNKELIIRAKKGVKIINVARGKILNEDDVKELLDSGHIDSVALDVFQEEPPNKFNKLLEHKNSIFGSHNSSNTIEAVDRVSKKAIELMANFLARCFHE